MGCAGGAERIIGWDVMRKSLCEEGTRLEFRQGGKVWEDPAFAPGPLRGVLQPLLCNA